MSEESACHHIIVLTISFFMVEPDLKFAKNNPLYQIVLLWSSIAQIRSDRRGRIGRRGVRVLCTKHLFSGITVVLRGLCLRGTNGAHER